MPWYANISLENCVQHRVLPRWVVSHRISERLIFSIYLFIFFAFVTYFGKFYIVLSESDTAKDKTIDCQENAKKIAVLEINTENDLKFCPFDCMRSAFRSVTFINELFVHFRNNKVLKSSGRQLCNLNFYATKTLFYLKIPIRYWCCM